MTIEELRALGKKVTVVEVDRSTVDMVGLRTGVSKLDDSTFEILHPDDEYFVTVIREDK